MFVDLLLDIVLVLLLIGFFISGYRQGLWISLGRMAGFLLGALLGVFLMPLAVSLVPSPGWRVVTMLATTAFLVLVFIALGSALGSWISSLYASEAFTKISQWSGAIANTVIVAILFSLISFSLSSFGVPGLTAVLKNSKVIAGVTSMTPESARSYVAHIRSEWIELGATSPESETAKNRQEETAKDVPEVGEKIIKRTESTVRISGMAYECGQNQTGTGFAISGDRILTNAHVVAGVETPQVETADGQVHDGTVVFFDPEKDAAVLALNGTKLPTIDSGSRLDVDDSAYSLGFPSGGPFKVVPGKVIARGPATVNDIYGKNPQMRDIYQLSSDIKKGNSGGPVVDEDGLLVGMVFARAPGSEVGYALTIRELEPILADAQSFDQPVSTGECIQ